MAFALLLLRSRRIEKQKQILLDEKMNAVQIQAGIQPKYTFGQKYTHWFTDVKQRIKRLNCLRNTRLHKISVNMLHGGTFENYIFKSLVGLIGGVFLTYLFFLLFVIILNFSVSNATLLCSLFGCVLTIGLAFSQSVRCVVFLMLPQLFSKRGRQALLAYALLLSMTGPARNISNNMAIMAESLACGQEQLKDAIRHIKDLIKKPFIAIKEAVKKVVEQIKTIVQKIKQIFLKIKRIVMAIVNVIKSAYNFLSKIFNICSKKLGTPFQRCTRAFNDAILDCQAKLGPLFSWLCSLVYVIQIVCYIVKPLDFICMLIYFISDAVVGVILKKLRTFSRHIRSIFYVKIRFSHSFEFETTHSKTMKEVTSGIMGEIRERTARLMDMFNIISAATGLFAFAIILKVIYYRYKFLTVERFDNKYITKEFREIDFRRAQMDRETLLPLNNRERAKFISVWSVRLVASEKRHLVKTLAILLASYFELAIFMLVDYSIYWLLSTIRYHGRYKTTVEAPHMAELHVEGNGFLAELYRGIVHSFQPMGTHMEIDSIPCLPDPIAPNYDKYIQIVFIAFLCLMLAIFEPYGLRIRQVIMCYYHPDRAKIRAIWLYNHIIRKRSTFLKFARRQLKRKFFGQDQHEKITCKEFLRAKINLKCLRFCLRLGSDKQEACVLCAQVFRPEDQLQPIHCSTPGCVGVFCEQCFADLNNICTICLDPIQYGDMSDVDLEKDSSEDETSHKFRRRSQTLNTRFEEEIAPSIASSRMTKSRDPSEDETSYQLISSSQKLDSRGEEGIPLSVVSSRMTKSSYDSDEDSVRSRYQVRRDPGLINLLNGDTRARAGEERVHETDSVDSDISTDYSDSYQYHKDFTKIEAPIRAPFEDVEQQRIPDYVCMNIFNSDYLQRYEREKFSRLRRIDEESSLHRTTSAVNFSQTTYILDGYLSDDEMDADETTLFFRTK